MANQARGEVDVELGGRVYTLRPTFDALANLEDITELGLQGLAARIVKQNVGIKIIVAVIYSGLIGAETPMDMLEVRKLVMRQGIQSLIVPCTKFLLNAMQGEEKLEADAAKASSEQKKT